MPCYRPLTGYRARSVNPSGKRSIVFSVGDGFRDLEVQVPCGRCIGCRLDRAHGWAVRCMHEASQHRANCFLTLTYQDPPPGGSLVKKDLQDFMKRLRKRIGRVRFLACGEYGSLLSRPHYHVLLFGYDFADTRVPLPGKDKGYRSAELESIWGKGRTHIGDLTFQSAAYVARYSLKKVLGDAEAASKHYQGRQPEFLTMSLRPGIGFPWLERFGQEVFPADFVVVNGREAKVPRYYDRMTEREDEFAFGWVKGARRRRAKLHADDNTPARLAAREEVRAASVSLLPRVLE